MASFKSPDFNERNAAARAAKLAALDQLRNKPAADPALVAERKAASEARDALKAEQRAARQLAAEEARNAKAAAKAAEAERRAAEATPLAAPLTDAERKAARDARYAARQLRKR